MPPRYGDAAHAVTQQEVEQRNKDSGVGCVTNTYTHAHIAAKKALLLVIGKHDQL